MQVLTGLSLPDLLRTLQTNTHIQIVEGIFVFALAVSYKAQTKHAMLSKEYTRDLMLLGECYVLPCGCFGIVFGV